MSPKNRSTEKRVFNGSVACWAQILVTLCGQLISIPIFLAHWSQSEYGLWIAFQTVTNLFQIFDISHNEFVGNLFFRIGIHRRRFMRKALWSACAGAAILGFVQVITVVGLIQSGVVARMFVGSEAVDTNIAHFCILLVIQSLVWWIIGSVGGLLIRVILPFGYFPHAAWWGVAQGILTTLGPLVIVVFGGKMVHAGIAQQAAILIVNIPFLIWIWRILVTQHLRPVSPSFRMMTNNMMTAQGITATQALQMVRVDGVRIILTAATGLQSLTSYSTIRTMANVFMQGLATIAGPVMPELMRFLGRRDQLRTDAACGLLWISVILIFSPALLVLQIAAEPFYILWTRNKLPFDSSLFALLSAGVMVFAVAQPAVAIVKGNNLLRAQLALSFAAGVVVVVIMAIMVPRIGLSGAGWALLAGEITAAIGYYIAATKWLEARGMAWHGLMLCLAISSVITTDTAIAIVTRWPDTSILMLALSSLSTLAITMLFWHAMPEPLRNRVLMLVNR